MLIISPVHVTPPGNTVLSAWSASPAYLQAGIPVTFSMGIESPATGCDEWAGSGRDARSLLLRGKPPEKGSGGVLSSLTAGGRNSWSQGCAVGWHVKVPMALDFSRDGIGALGFCKSTIATPGPSIS